METDKYEEELEAGEEVDEEELKVEDIDGVRNRQR